MNNQIRLHIFGLPHTITTNDYSHCAFTGKILRFGPMMLSRGYEVYHYGVESAEIICTKHFDVLTLNEWNKLKKESLKIINPSFSDEQIQNMINDKTQFIGNLGNTSLPIYKEFNKKLKILIHENYRNKSTDIICLPFGYAHDTALNELNCLCVESGIGYSNSYRDFRIFESYAILHKTMEKNTHYKHYWFVIPNYYNIVEWPLSLNPDKNKIGFFGRICEIKGINIIYEIAKFMPHVDIVLCGQGTDYQKYLSLPNIKYKEPIHGKERSKYLGSLNALLTPTQYVEPFCGVNVEAQLCGTPVIANECGAFVETIEPFKTGMLCHTLKDYCYGIEMALNGKFDREYIRKRAVELYDMYNVAYKYDYVFNSILDVHNGNGGWYSQKCYINLLEKSQHNNKIKYYYFYTPDYDHWHKHLSNTLSSHFDVNPICVDEITGLHDQHNNHHFTGCSFKVELVIDTIKKNMGNKIVFSDATWYVNKNKVGELYDLINLTNYGMTFANNSNNGDLNIGIICLDCNETILNFWNDVLTTLQNNVNFHDQKIVNSKIQHPNLFDYKKIISFYPGGDNCEQFDKTVFLMVKIYTLSSQNKQQRDSFRMEWMKNYELVLE